MELEHAAESRVDQTKIATCSRNMSPRSFRSKLKENNVPAPEIEGMFT